MGKNVIDLTKMTPEAIKSNVLNTTVTNPMTIYPVCIGMLLLAFWFIFEATWIFTLIGGLAVFGGIGMFAYNYFDSIYSRLFFLQKIRPVDHVFLYCCPYCRSGAYNPYA